jgi:hypothetical protein
MVLGVLAAVTHGAAMVFPAESFEPEAVLEAGSINTPARGPRNLSQSSFSPGLDPLRSLASVRSRASRSATGELPISQGARQKPSGRSCEHRDERHCAQQPPPKQMADT